MCEDWRTGNIGIRGASPLTLKNSYWLLLWRAFTIGPMAADLHKQIGILRGTTFFNMRTVFIWQIGNFEKLQKRYI
jgi:hypothetical protein